MHTIGRQSAVSCGSWMRPIVCFRLKLLRVVNIDKIGTYFTELLCLIKRSRCFGVKKKQFFVQDCELLVLQTYKLSRLPIRLVRMCDGLPIREVLACTEGSFEMFSRWLDVLKILFLIPICLMVLGCVRIVLVCFLDDFRPC